MVQEPSAAIIIIGNEILSGRTLDKNTQHIAESLTKLGIVLEEVRIIPDQENRIIETVNQLRQHVNYVFTTGGIGPTHDDITTPSIAKAFGVPVVRNKEAADALTQKYESEGKLNEYRLKMADVPEGADLIANPISIAPGYRMENVFVLAGIPAIMQVMFDHVIPHLKTGSPIHSKSISGYILEGDIAEILGDLQKQYHDVEIGSYPFVKDKGPGTTLVFRSTNEKSLILAYEQLKTVLHRQQYHIIKEE